MKRLINGSLWFFIFGLVVIGAIGLGLYELAKWLSEEAFDCMVEVSND